MRQGGAQPRQVLFVCADNHYRSRYAEIIFNHSAALGQIPWQASSRGLVLDPARQTRLSSHVLARLGVLGIEPPLPLCWPTELIEQDLAAADLVIALDRTEHRPLIRCRHRGWDDQIEYWEIGDIDVIPAAEAFEAVDHEVAHLMRIVACAA